MARKWLLTRTLSFFIIILYAVIMNWYIFFIEFPHFVYYKTFARLHGKDSLFIYWPGEEVIPYLGIFYIKSMILIFIHDCSVFIQLNINNIQQFNIKLKTYWWQLFFVISTYIATQNFDGAQVSFINDSKSNHEDQFLYKIVFCIVRIINMCGGM